jgi:hypothetical protein
MATAIGNNGSINDHQRGSTSALLSNPYLEGGRMNSSHKYSGNLAGATALALLLALAVLTGFSSPAAFAQDTDQSTATRHNPEGSWLYKVSIPDPPDAPIVFLGTETYAAGGGYVEADQLSFTPGYLATAGHGAWESTGDNTFLLTYMNLTYDKSGNATGSSRVRQKTKLDGDKYSGSGDYFYYDLDGKVTASGTFTITAKRILVQAPK